MTGTTRTHYIIAQFYNPGEYGSNQQQQPYAGAALNPLAINYTESKSQITQIAVTFSYTTPDIYGTAYKWHDYIKKGRRMALRVAHTYDSPATEIPIGTYIIENIEQVKTAGDMHLVISGPELTQELADKLLWTPIGTYRTDLTYLATAAPAPHTTIVANPAATGDDTVAVANAGWAAVDDEVRLTTDTGTIHATTIKEIAGNTITLNHKLPLNAATGKTVTFRKRKIVVDSAARFYEGDVVKVYRDSGGDPPYDGYLIEALEGNGITLSHGLLDGAAAGNIVMRDDYATPTTADVSQVMDIVNDTYPFTGWTAVIEPGRTSASALATKGASAFATLTQIANTHGEYFLGDTQTTGFGQTMLPQQRILYRHTCHDIGLKLVAPQFYPDLDAAIADINKGIIISITERIPRLPVDTLYVKGAGAGINQITLADSSSAVRDEILAKGFFLQGSPGDIYKPYRLFAPLVNAYREALVTIDILPESASPEAIGSAADMMLRQAANYLSRAVSGGREYSVRIMCRRRIRPGDIVLMDYESTEFGVTFVDTPLQVLSVTLDVSTDGLLYDLVLSTNLDPNEQIAMTDESTVSAELIKFTRLREAFEAMPAMGNYRSTFYTGGPIPLPNATTYTAGDGIRIENKAIRIAAPDFAGPGLDTDNFDLKIRLGAASGLTLADNTLRMVTPSSIAADTTNQVAADGHTHLVVAADNMDIYPGHLFKSTSSGAGTLRRLAAITEVTTPLLRTASGPMTIQPATTLTQIVTGAWTVQATAASMFNLNNQRLDLNGHLRFTSASPVIDTGSATPLTLAPAAQLNINPGGDTVFQWNANSELRSSTYQAQQAGWSLSHGASGGHLDVRSLFADEFHIKAFIAELEMAFAGGFRITKSRGVVSRPFTLPAGTGISTTVYFHDTPGWEGVPLFDRRQDEIVALTYADIGTPAAMGGTLYGVVNRNSYTAISTTKEQSWSISWTYLLSGAAAAGQKITAGAVILDYGLPPHMHFIEANVLDPAASPYLRSVSIPAVNAATRQPAAYDVHFQAGALSNLPNVGREYGIFAGRSRGHSHAIFTDTRNEIHNGTFILYGDVASDLLSLRVNAVGVDTSTATSRAPITDVAFTEIQRTGGTTYESNVDEEFNVLGTDYLWNTPGKSASAEFTLESIAGTPTTALVRVAVSSVGTATRGDEIVLKAQLIRSDGISRITEEAPVARWGDDGTYIAHFNQITGGSVWTGARLRLTWYYHPAILTPTIKLDPAAPSIAAGNPLPTGFLTGGDGFWTGFDIAAYKVRIGKPNGVSLRWNGYSLEITGTDGNDVINFNGNGNSSIDGVLTIGTNGGLW